MRRFIVFLLILAVLPLGAWGESGAQRLEKLDILSQRDPRLQEEKYYYQDMYFRIGGCKPASVTNALLALLGDEDTDAPQLLLELKRGLVYSSQDKKATIDIYRLPGYLRNPRKEAAEVKGMLKNVSAIVTLDAREDNVSPAMIASQMISDDCPHPLIIREINLEQNWQWLVELSAQLCKWGYPDARLAFCAAGVGTEDTSAPLRSGSSGHYVAMYFQAEEFYREGTLYLLDSLPRAMEGDIYGLFEQYPSQYAFVAEKWHPFNEIYDATRITDPVLQFSLKPAVLQELSSTDAKNDTARKAMLRKQAEGLNLFGYVYFMLYIP